MARIITDPAPETTADKGVTLVEALERLQRARELDAANQLELRQVIQADAVKARQNSTASGLFALGRTAEALNAILGDEQ